MCDALLTVQTVTISEPGVALVDWSSDVFFFFKQKAACEIGL